MLRRLILLWTFALSLGACRELEPDESRPLAPVVEQVDYGCGVGCDDCRLWLFGGESTNSVPQSTVMSFDGTTWTNEGELPAARAYAGAVVQGGKVWLFGGSQSNSIYTSTDGVSWEAPGTLPAGMSPFTNVSYFRDTFWITGGGITEGPVNTSFTSVDGISWTLGGTLPMNVTRHASMSSSGNLYLLGGFNGSTLSSMAYTSDGVTWNQTNSVLPGTLSDMAKARWNDRTWLAGGNSGSAIQTAVLSSPGAVNWTAVGHLPAARMRGSLAAYRDKLWFIGGMSADGIQTNTIWSSPDGETWTDEGVLERPLSGAAIAVYSPSCGTGAP